MKMLTPRQKTILDFIRGYIAEKGYSPSYREIKNHFGFSSLGSVYKHIVALKDKGALTNEKSRSRSVSLLEEGQPMQSQGLSKVTFMGYLSAVTGLETLSQTHSIELPKVLVPSPDSCYALRIRGDFLSDDLIGDGDLLVIETEQVPKAGDLALVKVDNAEMLLRSYYPEGDYVRLESGGTSMESVMVRRESVLVYGILVGLLRAY